MYVWKWLLIQYDLVRNIGMVYLKVFLLVVALSAVLAEVDNKMAQYFKDCSKETGIDLSKYKRADKKYWENRQRLCYGTCMALKIGTFNDKGEPVYSEFQKYFQQKGDSYKLKEVIKYCTKNIKNDEGDKCQVIGRKNQCIWKKMWGI